MRKFIILLFLLICGFIAMSQPPESISVQPDLKAYQTGDDYLRSGISLVASKSPGNFKKAAEFLSLAAGMGKNEAYFFLGQLYQQGHLTTQDFKLAAIYYQKGVDKGDPYSMNALGYLYYKGLGVVQAYENAFLLFKASSDKGIANSDYFLGLCYKNGYGVRTDKKKSDELLRRAALGGERSAIQELISEPLPENKSVISSRFQDQVKAFRKGTQNILADRTNNFEGLYQGCAVYYDWSGKFVSEILPLKLKLVRTGDGYSGSWSEGQSQEAPIAMKTFDGNKFVFQSGSNYVRNDHYSARQNEVWSFNEANLDLSFVQDSIQLAGYVRFYSLDRNEPGKPFQIILRKSIESKSPTEYKALNVQAWPNPASSHTSVKFNLAGSNYVSVSLHSLEGTLIRVIQQKLLPEGKYQLPITVDDLPGGVYLIKINYGDKYEVVKLVKQ